MAASPASALTIYTGRTGTDLLIEDATARSVWITKTVPLVPDTFRPWGSHRAGRDFSPKDRRGGPLVVIINQEFVRRYFEDAILSACTFSCQTDPSRRPPKLSASSPTVNTGRSARGASPRCTSLPQRGGTDRFVHVVARTAAPTAMISTVRNSILQMDTSAAVTVEPMTRLRLRVPAEPHRRRAHGLLGILGAPSRWSDVRVVSFAVTRRTSEIGIRVALGASHSAVVRLVLADSGLLVGVGLVAGPGPGAARYPPARGFLVANCRPGSRELCRKRDSAAPHSLLARWSPARPRTKIAPRSRCAPSSGEPPTRVFDCPAISSATAAPPAPSNIEMSTVTLTSGSPCAGSAAIPSLPPSRFCPWRGDWGEYRHLHADRPDAAAQTARQCARSVVMLYQQGTNMGSNMGSRMHSYPLYQDLQQRAEPLAEVLCRRMVPASVSIDNQTERVEAEMVSGNYFSMLGSRRRSAGLQLAGRRSENTRDIRSWCSATTTG